MTLKLLVAPVGAGKTQAVQERLVALQRARPLANSWVLLSGERQITTFRQRLIGSGSSSRVFFNIEFFSFYTLYHRLLAVAGRPQRCLDDATRSGLIRAICSTEDLHVFHRIAHTSGFVRILADFIYELKQNLVTPEALTAAAASEKEAELARLYAAYQRLLQHNDLVDREGEGWLALEALDAFPDLAGDVNLLIADGFDQFNVLQANLLALLGARAHESLVTLTTVPGREATIGRRFAKARERLRAIHARLGLPLDETEASGYSDTRHSALRHLSHYIFVPRAPVYTPHPPTPSPLNGEGETSAASGGEVSPVQLSLFGDTVGARRLGGRTRAAPLPHTTSASSVGARHALPLPNPYSETTVALRLVEAPDPAREVGAVLRRVKTLLLDGCRPDDVLIALRDWTSYGQYFPTQGRMYDLPLALHLGESLARNPAVAALLDLLQLSSLDFRRRELLDVLRSPYFAIPGMPSGGTDLLDRLSTSMMVTGGRTAWHDALETAQRSAGAADDDEAETLSFDPQLLKDTQQALAAFFDAVTLPETGTVEDYVFWLEGLMGYDEPDPDVPEPDATPAYTLNVPSQVRVFAGPGIVERDLTALNAFAAALRGLIASGSLFSSLGYSRRLSRTEFLRELQIVVASTTAQRNSRREGRVLVTTVTDARGLPHKHIFVLGLSEGLFPAPVPEDPLLLDTERLRLAASGIELSTQAERADDDGLFYELLNQAHDSLTLSRPYTKDGSPWVPSHLWRAVRDLFPNIAIERLRVGDVVPANEAATAQEVALAVADGADELRGWLMAAYPDYWQRMRLGRKVERSRISRLPYDHYSGRLRDETLIGHAAQLLDSNRVWSATQLGEYGICGFRFFSRRLLRLEALQEPEDGMDIRQLGTLYHEILEATYTGLAQANITITPDCTDFALETLHNKAAALLHNAPRRLGFRASAMWEQEKITLLRRLEALVKEDFSGSSPIDKAFPGAVRQPHRFEVAFGSDEPLTIDLEDELLRVTGKIDRVDWQGDRAIIIDYKTGSTKIPTDEIRRGRNFQMMLYLLVAQPLLGVDEVGGVFWHLSSRETSGKMISSSEIDQALVATAKAHIRRYLALGRSGDFAAQTSKLEDGRCAHHCDYVQMCRMAIMNKSKREL